MPSTDIDGSPIFIIDYHQARLLARMAFQDFWSPYYDRDFDDLVQRMAATFPDTEWPGRKFSSD